MPWPVGLVFLQSSHWVWLTRGHNMVFSAV